MKCVDAKAAEAREAVEVLAAAATVAEGQEVTEKGVAVLDAVATEAAGSEEGDEDGNCVTTNDSLGRSVVFCDAHIVPHPPSRRFCRPDAGFWAKDAEFRDRSASDMCPIATLRGLLL